MNNTKSLLIILITLACYGCNIGSSPKNKEQKVNNAIPDGIYSGHTQSTVSVPDPIPVTITMKNMSAVVAMQDSKIISGNFSTDLNRYKNTTETCFEGTYANKPIKLKHCSLTNHEQDQDIPDGHWYFYGMSEDIILEFDNVDDNSNTYSNDVKDDNNDD